MHIHYIKMLMIYLVRSQGIAQDPVGQLAHGHGTGIYSNWVCLLGLYNDPLIPGSSALEGVPMTVGQLLLSWAEPDFRHVEMGSRA